MRAQEGIPGWMVIVGIVISLIGVIVMIYLAVKAGQVGVDVLG